MAELFRAILIETRNVCNRKCWFCKFGQERQDSKILQMDWDTIRRILGNLKDLNYTGRISWYNINEPLSDSRMCKVLKLTREYCPRAFLSFATNGDLLNGQLYGKLKQNGLDALGVSVYDDKTLARMEKIADAQMVLIDMRSARPGVLDNRAGNILQENNAFLKFRSRFENRSCERPFSMIVVNPAGQVVLCCADMYWDVVMGDVREQRLEEIWNNDCFTHYRNTLATEGRRNLKLCKHCSYSGKGVKPFFPFQGKRPRQSLRDLIITKMRRFSKPRIAPVE